jgi:hypothetical protein
LKSRNVIDKSLDNNNVSFNTRLLEKRVGNLNERQVVDKTITDDINSSFITWNNLTHNGHEDIIEQNPYHFK